MHRLRWVGLLAAAIVIATAAPSVADLNLPPAQEPPVGTVPGDGVTTGNATGSSGGCHYYATPNGMGLTCGNGTYDPQYIKKTLGKDPLPTCWYEVVAPEDLAVVPVEATGGAQWRWFHCLKGVDPKTLREDPKAEVVTSGPVLIKTEDIPPEWILTVNQATLVENFLTQRGAVPAPVLAASPTLRPRVRQLLSLYNIRHGDESVEIGAAVLRARLIRTEIYPLGKGTDTKLACPGFGFVATATDRREDHREMCWYQYMKSSHGQPYTFDGLPAYEAWVVGTWRTEISINGAPFTTFNEFTKSGPSRLPVTEVQSIVVN